MEYHPHHQQTQMCSKHNQPIIVINSDSKIGPSCVICVQNWPGNVSIEQFNQQQQAFYDKLYKKMDLKHQGFQSLLEKLFNYKEKVISGLDKIIYQIMDQIQMLKDSKIKISSIMQSDSNKEIMIKEIQDFEHKQSLINKDVKDEIGNQLKSIQLKLTEIDQLSKILKHNQIAKTQNEENAQLNKKIKIQEVQQDKVKQFTNPQYYLVDDSTVKLEENCFALTFNNDNNLLIAGSNNDIIVYEFMKGKIVKELQKLTNHTQNVNCLQFMKKSNSFVSGSEDSTIILWIYDQNNKWIAQQVLKEHTDNISCFLLNMMEDQLISGSVDCTVKCWKLMTGSWACQQTMRTKYEVRNLSFNEIEEKLIVSENNFPQDPQKSSIQVLMQNNNKQWFIGQTLDFDGLGWRLCFTIGDQFVFTTNNSDLLEIYDYENNRKIFNKVSQIQIQNFKYCCPYFPCSYIKSLNTLILKQGEYLNIIRVNENYKYELIQAIQFSNNCVSGQMSDDGKYIVTWNGSAKIIQIRKIQYLE